MADPVDPFEGSVTEGVALRTLRGVPNGSRPSRRSKQTPSERRRILATWSGRIGADLKEEIRELAASSLRSQGEVVRDMLLHALEAVNSGELEI